MQSAQLSGRGGSTGRSASRITARVNQPVEGVPVEPFCFAQDERGQRVRAPDERITFAWYRGKEMWACASYHCPLNSNVASCCKPAPFPLQDTQVAKAGGPVATSIFCEPKCLREYWRAHRLLRYPPRPREGGKRPELPTDPDEDADKRLMAEVDVLPPVLDPEEDDWVKVGTGMVYVPTEWDVGHKLLLKCSLRLGDGTVIREETTSKVVQSVAPPPPPRTLTTRTSVPPNVRVIDHNLGFRIVSYNVLAEIYATQAQYPYCPLWALSFEYRRKLLKLELKRYNADILCLQEVQADHFNSKLYHDLSAMGYEGLFKAKTRASMGREGRIDGCALFYRKSRFALSEKYVIEFNDAAEATYQVKGKQMQPQREALLKRLKRDNVAQVVVLEMTHGVNGARLTSPMRLCISNTHLSWNPEYDDVKLWQTHMLMKELQKFIISRNLPLVLCGDFNSDTSSAVYKLLASNRVGSRTRFVGLPREDLPRDPYNILHGKISHNVALDSAFRAFHGRDPEFTNYTQDFVGCLDHAWITTDKLLVKSLLEIPTKFTLTAFARTALPNPQFPSDHVALVFDLLPIASSAATAATGAAGAGAGASVTAGAASAFGAAATVTPGAASTATAPGATGAGAGAGAGATAPPAAAVAMMPPLRQPTTWNR